MRILLLMIGMLTFQLGYGQDLTGNAVHVKTNYPTEYQKTIRANAVNEWGNDHNMVVFQINLQCDELVALINSFKGEHSSILYTAIINWSTEGYESANKQAWNNMGSFGLASALKLNVNWQMVKFEYDMQVQASSAY